MTNTKEYILKTSLTLFLQKSYRDVTMNEIVVKTGLSKGAFYHYFPSKEALFKEIATLFMTMGNVKYSDFSRHSLQSFYIDYIEYLDNALSTMSQMVPETNESASKFNFFLILFEAVSRFPELLEMESAMHKKDLEAWKAILVTARSTGEIQSHSTDEAIANLFLYSTDGVFIRFINNENKDSYKELIRKAYDSIYENMKV
jgi:TetR/AcrR family transcriptional regulator, transcriptional repressor for nem operon